MGPKRILEIGQRNYKSLQRVEVNNTTFTALLTNRASELFNINNSKRKLFHESSKASEVGWLMVNYVKEGVKSQVMYEDKKAKEKARC